MPEEKPKKNLKIHTDDDSLVQEDADTPVTVVGGAFFPNSPSHQKEEKERIEKEEEEKERLRRRSISLSSFIAPPSGDEIDQEKFKIDKTYRSKCLEGMRELSYFQNQGKNEFKLDDQTCFSYKKTDNGVEFQIEKDLPGEPLRIEVPLVDDKGNALEGQFEILYFNKNGQFLDYEREGEGKSQISQAWLKGVMKGEYEKYISSYEQSSPEVQAQFGRSKTYDSANSYNSHHEASHFQGLAKSANLPVPNSYSMPSINITGNNNVVNVYGTPPYYSSVPPVGFKGAYQRDGIIKGPDDFGKTEFSREYNRSGKEEDLDIHSVSSSSTVTPSFSDSQLQLQEEVEKLKTELNVKEKKIEALEADNKEQEEVIKEFTSALGELSHQAEEHTLKVQVKNVKEKEKSLESEESLDSFFSENNIFDKAKREQENSALKVELEKLKETLDRERFAQEDKFRGQVLQKEKNLEAKIDSQELILNKDQRIAELEQELEAAKSPKVDAQQQIEVRDQAKSEVKSEKEQDDKVETLSAQLQALQKELEDKEAALQASITQANLGQRSQQQEGSLQGGHNDPQESSQGKGSDSVNLHKLEEQSPEIKRLQEELKKKEDLIELLSKQNAQGEKKGSIFRSAVKGVLNATGLRASNKKKEDIIIQVEDHNANIRQASEGEHIKIPSALFDKIKELDSDEYGEEKVRKAAYDAIRKNSQDEKVKEFITFHEQGWETRKAARDEAFAKSLENDYKKMVDYFLDDSKPFNQTMNERIKKELIKYSSCTVNKGLGGVTILSEIPSDKLENQEDREKLTENAFYRFDGILKRLKFGNSDTPEALAKIYQDYYELAKDKDTQNQFRALAMKAIDTIGRQGGNPETISNEVANIKSMFETYAKKKGLVNGPAQITITQKDVETIQKKYSNKDLPIQTSEEFKEDFQKIKSFATKRPTSDQSQIKTSSYNTMLIHLVNNWENYYQSSDEAKKQELKTILKDLMDKTTLYYKVESSLVKKSGSSLSASEESRTHKTGFYNENHELVIEFNLPQAAKREFSDRSQKNERIIENAQKIIRDYNDPQKYKNGLSNDDKEAIEEQRKKIKDAEDSARQALGGALEKSGVKLRKNQDNIYNAAEIALYEAMCKVKFKTESPKTRPARGNNWSVDLKQNKIEVIDVSRSKSDPAELPQEISSKLVTDLRLFYDYKPFIADFDKKFDSYLKYIIEEKVILGATDDNAKEAIRRGIKQGILKQLDNGVSSPIKTLDEVSEHFGVKREDIRLNINAENVIKAIDGLFENPPRSTGFDIIIANKIDLKEIKIEEGKSVVSYIIEKADTLEKAKELIVPLIKAGIVDLTQAKEEIKELVGPPSKVEEKDKDKLKTMQKFIDYSERVNPEKLTTSLIEEVEATKIQKIHRGRTSRQKIKNAQTQRGVQ